MMMLRTKIVCLFHTSKIPLESLRPSTEMILFIPRASGDGNQRVNLALTTTYDSALDIIYETIGCDEVNRKPTLLYKLVSATAKTPATSFGSDNDWEGFRDDIKAAQNKRKETVAANIIVADQVHVYSLISKIHIFTFITSI